jgi:type I restriction enzyme R subunit
VQATEAFCAAHGVQVAEIEAFPAGGLDRLNRIAEAVDRLISPDPVRKEFLTNARWANKLYQAVKPDSAVTEWAGRISCLNLIGSAIRERTGEGPIDISGVMATINHLLDESIAADGFRVRERPDGERRGAIDLSGIDFEALAKRFAKAQRKNVELEQLRASVRAQLERLVRVNPTRADYQQKFEELIESYNVGSRNIDELFRELLELSRDLSHEEQRHVREQLTEEELTVFDLLTRPGPDLTAQERGEVKKVARDLLRRVRAALVLDWRQRAQARAQVRLAIEDTLDEELPRSFTPDIYRTKCDVLFEHVFESFGEAA